MRMEGWRDPTFPETHSLGHEIALVCKDYELLYHMIACPDVHTEFTSTGGFSPMVATEKSLAGASRCIDVVLCRPAVMLRKREARAALAIGKGSLHTAGLTCSARLKTRCAHASIFVISSQPGEPFCPVRDDSQDSRSLTRRKADG